MSESQASGGRVVVIAAMIANGIIAVAKFGAAAMTGSSALMSEGMHSVADTGNEALLLLGRKRAARPPDRSHPFGYGQEMYFWGLIVATVLFGLGGGLSVYEGIAHLMDGAELGNPLWNYVVLGVAFVAEGVSWMVALKHFRERSRGRPFLPAFKASRDPSLYVPLAEDTAALAGIVVAFLGVWLSHRLGLPALDGVASLLIGLILAGVALFLAWETRGLLVGESVDEDLRRMIREVARRRPEVTGVQRVLTMYLSPEEILLNLGVRLRADGAEDGVARSINRLEKDLREADGRITRVFVEVEAAGEGGVEPPF